MRRLLRWTFNLSAAVSAVLFVGVCVLWVRGTGTADQVSWAAWQPWQPPGSRPLARIGWFQSVCGRVSLSYERLDYASGWMDRTIRSSVPPGLHWTRRDLSIEKASGISPLVLYGVEQPFYLGRRRGVGAFVGNTVYGVRAPAWFLACLSAALPLAWAVRRVHLARLRRRSPTACTVCGYDLRATPGRCPECGAVPERAVRA